jgi:hypothetical protein
MGETSNIIGRNDKCMHEEFYLLGYNAVYSVESQPTF